MYNPPKVVSPLESVEHGNLIKFNVMQRTDVDGCEMSTLVKFQVEDT